MRRSSKSFLPFIFIRMLFSLECCLAIDSLEDKVENTVQAFNQVTHEEIDKMDRQTVAKSIGMFNEATSLIDQISQSNLPQEEKNRLQGNLARTMGNYFVRLSEPYANLAQEPERLVDTFSPRDTAWEKLGKVFQWSAKKAAYVIENCFRDFSRAFLPFHRDSRGEIVFGLPPVFPRWGNDWARSDATDPMAYALLQRVEEIAQKQGRLSEEDKASLIAYATALDEMSRAEPILHGPTNAAMRKFQLWWAPLQNLHPVDLFWLVGAMSENSTWVSGVIWTGLFLVFAKSRTENSGLKAWNHWKKAEDLVQQTLPTECRNQLLNTSRFSQEEAPRPIRKRRLASR